ncbi:ribosomal protein S6 glutaminyl transferase [Bacillus sp. JCM 19046]|nr:ribosomal protein S6 glutaminyl transferase [Bacillus sp. JCM 19045]GAF16498.1 ribosomal protein S6 glutaminyl transferase [Bacillus sp. JCM 19046]
MNLVTFNPFRTIGIPGIDYVKPEKMFEERLKIEQADLCLFPENWQATSLTYGFKKQIFPSIESIQLGYSKIEMTRAFWAVCADHVPKTVILGTSRHTIDQVLHSFSFPFVAKTVRSSMGQGVFLIKNKSEFIEYAKNHDVLYVQEYIENIRDLRLCVIGTKVVTSYWRENKAFHNNVAQGGAISFDDIPQEAIDLVEDIAKQLNINHAGFDIIATDDKLYLLEFNTLFGNQGFHEQGLRAEDFIYTYIKESVTN